MSTVHVVRCCLKPLAILLLTLRWRLRARFDHQSNAAGDRVHLIDPVTNWIVGDPGIRIGPWRHRTPDGTRIVSNEADSTLDVADGVKVAEDPAQASQQHLDYARWEEGLRGNQARGQGQPGRGRCDHTASPTKVEAVRARPQSVCHAGRQSSCSPATPKGFVSSMPRLTRLRGRSPDGIRPMTSDKNPDGRPVISTSSG
jgi:hypothetical protein